MLDTGNNLVLSVETDRTINLNSSRYFLGVEGDKEVKIIRFQLDRYYCGIDLSVFKSRVNYKLSNGKEYYGEATMADFDEAYIYVEWTLDPSVTSVKGRVDFLVQLTKLDEDGSILKRYNSTMAIGRVEEGLNPEDQLPESIKKDILAIAEDTLTQLKESKTEFDSRLKIISDKQNEIIVRLDATDLKINKFDNDYEAKMNAFHTDYQEKMESFETDYSEKMKSAIKNIEDTSVQSVTNVENAKDEALQNIQNKSTEFLNNIDEAENKAIKNIENSGEHYQEQINTLQQESAQQDEVLDKLNEEVDLKVTQPYLNNKGENHVANSDNGALKNVIVEGDTVQNSTKGINLFDFSKVISDGVNIIDYQKQTITIPAKTNNTGYIQTLAGLCPNIIAGTYILSVTCSNSNAIKCIHLLESDKDIDFSIACELTDEDINSKVAWYNNESSTVENVISNIQIEEGSTAHDYEPYTGCQPSPNPDYPQEVKGVDKIEGKVVGKNLFDINQFLSDCNQTLNNDSTITLKATEGKYYLNIPANDNTYIEYVVVRNSSSGKANMQIFYKDGTYTYAMTQSGDLNIVHRIKLNKAVDYISVLAWSNITVKDIRIVISQTTTDYQPYQSQSFNYTLSNPLYRLSDSVYDYIDVDKGKIVRNVGVVTFDGSDDEEWLTESYNRAYLIKTDMIKPSGNNKSNIVMCTKYHSSNHMESELQDDNSIMVFTNKAIEFRDNKRCPNSTTWKSYLSQNPITVYYQLATPTEEPLPSDLQTLLQSLKSYYPQTNIMFDTEVEPYINFDYKLNLKSWIEDKDNKEIEYDKSVNDIQPYSDSYIEKWFNLMRTGRVYTVKFPLWETSQSPVGEKIDANRGLICEPSTPVYAGQNDYDEISVFKTFDVNAYVDNDGEIHLTAFKGDENFRDTGKVDVFVLTMSYYEKTWTEDGYWYYSISDSPKPGYTIAKECLKKDGSIRPYALYAKYVAGPIDGQPYSSKGLIPCYYPFETISAYHLVSYCKQRGKYYTGGLMWDYKYIWTRFMLKFANTNSQAVLGGVFDYAFQYPITIAEENVKRVIVSKSNATRYVVGSCVSIGDWGDATSMDRSNKNCHNIARNVKILSIEDVDDSNSALNLDLVEPITTTTTCRATTMHYLSGYSDEILGRDGSLGTDPKSVKHPIVISGIECAVGGYEIPCNAMMNILNANGDREVYITHDATKLSTNTQTIMNTWKKSDMLIKTSKVNNWQYITKMGIDTELGCVLPLAAGESGSGSSTGFGDGLYTDGATSGQREFLLLGRLRNGSISGLSCLYASLGFSATWWTCLARISIMAVRGE